jgi:undecaprenyl-diphosphatase
VRSGGTLGDRGPTAAHVGHGRGAWRCPPRLSHEDAARFSFLLATPVIFAAGLLKLPDLFGPLGQGIRGQVLLGSLMSGLAAYLSVRYLTRYVQVRSLRPFGWYCLIAGLLCFGWFLR